MRWRSTIPALALAGLHFLGAADAPAQITNRSVSVPAAKRYIVMLQRGADQEGCASEHRLNRSQTFRHAINGFVADLDSAALARLKADARVLAVEEDIVCAHAIGQIIPNGIRRLGMDHFPMVSTDGSDKRINVDVALVDSGVQTNHPDLNVIQAVDFTGDGINTIFSHGTGCAGIIGALDNNLGVVGVAPGVRLWSARSIDNNNNGTLAQIVAGLNYVAAHADQISVCNLSIATYYGNDTSVIRTFEQPAVQALVNLGVVVVAGTGNDGGDIAGPDGIMDNGDDVMPAGFPESMAVSAMDPAADEISNYSNGSRTPHATAFVTSPGAAIDVAGPGNDILTTTVGSSYGRASGTSFATPHVSGLVALYIASHGRATNAAGVYAIRQAIINGALPQSQWNSTNTHDPDTNHEGLAMPSIAWATNAPKITGFAKAGSGVGLSFSTLNSYSNTVQFASSLSATSAWTKLYGTNGTGGIASITNPIVASNRFFRLATQPLINPLLTNRGVGTNIGSLGASANGSYLGTSNNVAGAIVNESTNSAVLLPIDTVGSRMTVPYQKALNPSNAFSIEIWSRPTQTNDAGTVVSSAAFVTNQLGGWALYQSNPTGADGNGWYFRCFNNSGNLTYNYVSWSGPLSTNSWYHLVGTFDGTNEVLYMNGFNVSSYAWPGGQRFRPNAIGPLELGVVHYGTSWGSGMHDECALYTNALTAARVLAHYQSGTNGARVTPYQYTVLSDNPIGYWRLNEH